MTLSGNATDTLLVRRCSFFDSCSAKSFLWGSYVEGLFQPMHPLVIFGIALLVFVQNYLN